MGIFWAKGPHRPPHPRPFERSAVQAERERERRSSSSSGNKFRISSTQHRIPNGPSTAQGRPSLPSIIFLLYTLPRLLSLADQRSTNTEHIAPSRACLEAAGTLIASVLRSPPPLWTPWPQLYELTLSRIVYAIDPSFDSHTTRMTSARPTATIRIRRQSQVPAPSSPPDDPTQSPERHRRAHASTYHGCAGKHRRARPAQRSAQLARQAAGGAPSLRALQPTQGSARQRPHPPPLPHLAASQGEHIAPNMDRSGHGPRLLQALALPGHKGHPRIPCTGRHPPAHQGPRSASHKDRSAVLRKHVPCPLSPRLQRPCQVLALADGPGHQVPSRTPLR